MIQLFQTKLTNPPKKTDQISDQKYERSLKDTVERNQKLVGVNVDNWASLCNFVWNQLNP